MKLSTTTSKLSRTLPLTECVEIIKNAGFDCYDLTFCSLPNDHELYGDDRMEKARELREYADKIGIECNQAHAPFPTSTGDEEKDEKIFWLVVRSMEVAAYLGAKNIVVHPKQHLPYLENAEELFELNMAFYRRLIPYAEKYGIVIATENMFQWHHNASVCLDSTCSRPKEFIRYVDEINSPYLRACVDIGHVGLVDVDPCDMIKRLGKDRICCLHVHDNNKIHDHHTLPYLGKVDWTGVMTALKEAGYAGDFTYEADSFLATFPDELFPSCEKMLHDVGRHLISIFEKA